MVPLGDPDSMGNGVMDNLVLTANISGVEILFVAFLGISDLTGIEDFTALKELYCLQNNLTNLDLSSNTALIRLNCANNNLTSLDLSNNTALIRLNCANNNLVTLNIKNGNNLNITEFSADPNLFCVQVDDVNVGFINSIGYPVYNDCTTTYIPDDAFEQKMIDLITAKSGLNNPDPTIDDYMITSDIIEYIENNLGFLPISASGISDLTGIEDFTNLKRLDCSKNNIVNLDLSSNTALTYLDCSLNYSSSIDSTTCIKHIKCKRFN